MSELSLPRQSRRARVLAVLVPVVMTALLTVPLAAQWIWQVEEVVANDVAGAGLAFRADGTPTIAYSLFRAEEVRLATRQANGTWSTEFVDRGRQYYNGLSFAYGEDGRAGISYGFGPIRFAEKVGPTWSLQTVFKGSATTNATSLVYRNNVPHISFSAGGGKSYLAFAHRPASKWIVETADKTGYGDWNSLAFDPAGRAVIAYGSSSNNQGFNLLKVAVRQPAGGWTNSIVEGGTAGYGVHAAVAFSASGHPAIVHGNGTVRFLEFAGDWGAGSGAWEPYELDAGPFAGAPSIVFDGDEPIVAWRQANGDPHPKILKIARRVGGVWTTYEITSFDPPVNWISGTSLALLNGLPAVAFTPQSSSVWNLVFAQATPEP